MTRERIYLPGPKGRLGAIWTPAAGPVALILPPDPRFNGSAETNLCAAAETTLLKRGFAVLRLQYRGVGWSDGSWSDAKACIDDALAAIDWLTIHHQGRAETWEVGIGLGAWVALEAGLRRPDIVRIIGAGTPVNVFDCEPALAERSAPVTLIHAVDDRITTIDTLRAAARRAARGPALDVREVPIGGHTFDGQGLNYLAGTIGALADASLARRAA